MRRVLATLVAIVAITVSGCGSSDPFASGSAGAGGDGPIVVGSAGFAESVLIMHMYAAALRRAGLEVTTNPRLGTREITNAALQDGSIDVMPEYTGNLLRSFDSDATATRPRAVYQALQRALPPGLRVLDYSSAQDSDVLVVTGQTSRQYNLTSMAQLGRLCGQFTLGAAEEWPERWARPISEIYGCTFSEIIATDAGGPVTIDALRSGEAQVVNLFTTSPVVEANGWVELADPKQMYPAQNIVPLVARGRLNQAGMAALNAVSAALTTEKLTELNRRVAQERAVPAELAEQFVAGLDLK